MVEIRSHRFQIKMLPEIYMYSLDDIKKKIEKRKRQNILVLSYELCMCLSHYSNAHMFGI